MMEVVLTKTVNVVVWTITVVIVISSIIVVDDDDGHATHLHPNTSSHELHTGACANAMHVHLLTSELKVSIMPST